MRGFIAIDLNKDLINEIFLIQNKLRKKFLFHGKFTEKENLHLTLKFLGEISEEKVEEVKKLLKNIKLKEFEVCLGEAGVFSRKNPKILWIKLSGKGIFELQKQIDEELKGLFKKEERFMSHITIARIKNSVNKEEFFNYLKSIKTRKIGFLVKDFSLKKSELFDTGPVYENLEEYVLNSGEQEPL